MPATEELETLPDSVKATLDRYMREECDRFDENLDRRNIDIISSHRVRSRAVAVEDDRTLGAGEIDAGDDQRIADREPQGSGGTRRIPSVSRSNTCRPECVIPTALGSDCCP